MRFGRVFTDIIKDGLKHINLRGFSDKDTLTKVQVTPSGIDSTPHDKYVALYCETATRGSGAVIGYIHENFITKAGEIRIYSEDKDGELKAYVYCDEEGVVNVNGDTDNMVRYTPLKNGFDGLRTDFNALVAKHNQLVSEVNLFIGLYNVHTPTPTTLATPSTAGGIASTASITNSKIDNVKTN